MVHKNKQTISVGLGDTGAVVVGKINAAFASSGGQLVASLDSTGQLNLAAASGNTIRIDNFKTTAGVAYTEAQGANAVTGLGLTNYFAPTGFGEGIAGAATFAKGVTVNPTGSVISSKALLAGGAIATAGTKIVNLAGFNLSASATTSQFSIGVDGITAVNFDLQSTNGLTIQGLVDKINAAGTINTKIQASFDSTTGKLNINVIDATVKTVSIGNSSTASTTENWGFGTGRADGTVVDSIAETFAIPSTAVATNNTLTSLTTQYNNIRSQIDALVTNGDTAYRGTNLLNGNNLVTNFNELRTSSLTTSGKTFTSAGLGLVAANFSTSTTINANLTQITSALSTLRSFSAGLATDLSTIQTRQDFTNNTINTLSTGAANLVNADQNEEGAKLLALQTRQSLGVTALSLASQSNQSILRLFS